MSNSNRSVENNYLEQIKNIEDEKTRTDVLLIKSVKELVSRVEKLEKGKAEQTEISTTETTTMQLEFDMNN